MPEHETEIDETTTGEAVANRDDWDQPIGELPRRPRRRLLGKGGNPLALSLLGVLLLACGFIGGVLVEKGQSNSGSSAGGGGTSGLAARFASLRSGTSGAGPSTTSGSSSSGSTGGAFGGASGASSSAPGSGFTRPTAGTVAYLDRSTLYVTNSEGNTVKVKTSTGTTVNKTVKSTVKDIHPGETVTITGATGSSGAITAESISAGTSGSGLAALFGGTGTNSTGGSGQSGAARTAGGGSGGPALFGSGG
jgi:hypothetical protein